MRLVKLGAITSTNDFLKEMASDSLVESFTLVTAESQTAGRGQMGARWESEPGKNLIMSLFISDSVKSHYDIFNLNVIVANAVVDVLQQSDIHNISIKWPNDIMAGTKKLGGILIENLFRADGSIDSVIGIGLNVWQQDFGHLSKATSILNVSGKGIEIGQLAIDISGSIKSRISKGSIDAEWAEYHLNLFRKGKPTVFEAGNERFMGKILSVARNGELQLEHEDGSVKSFAIRQIAMMY